jgi:hypothetical protein
LDTILACVLLSLELFDEECYNIAIEYHVYMGGIINGTI